MINKFYFQQFPYLESNRLIFRKFTLTDATEILSIRSNKEVMEFMDSDMHTSIEDSKNFLSGNLSTYEQEKGIFWAIIEKNTNHFIGDFSFWKIDHKNRRAEIGYSLKPEFWGNGYMTEAIQILTSFGFTKLQLHSFEANINPKNNASRQLLLNNGFKKEAYFRQNYYYKGTFLDSEIYSLLEEDLVKG